MLARGLGAACLVLVWAAAMGAGAAVPVSEDQCGPTIPQDDAGSGIDAGPTQQDAVEITEDAYYGGTIATPTEDGIDQEDWYVASWETNGEHLVMVNLSTAPAALYESGDQYVAPHMEIAAYKPGADEPTHEAEIQEDGSLSLQFVTDKSETWFFQTSLRGPTMDVNCDAGQGADAPPMKNYEMYIGCHPHCLTEQS